MDIEIKTMIENKQEFLDKLYALHRFGIKPGLERTLKLLENCGNPHLSIPAAHVAGTNGKGSVCSALASILTEAGYTTGLYTSPHLIDFNERIRINGKKISDEDIFKIGSKLFDKSDKIGSTFFEITTVLAFDYFARANVDIAIIETGMGGRFDSTNVLSPLLSIITQIDIDHTEYLGDTLEKIAFEKAGIIKPGKAVIISDNHPKLRQVFNIRAQEINAPIIFALDDSPVNIIENLSELRLLIENNSKIYEADLSGSCQAENLSAVFAGLDVLRENFNISDDNIKKGLANIRKNTGLKSRIEMIREEPPLIIDAAHNPAGIKTLVSTIRNSVYGDMKWNIVFGAMADKDIKEILRTFRPICKTMLACSPKIDRALTADKLMEYANEAGIENCFVFQSVEEATRRALELNEAALIAGSFYLIGEALPVLEEDFRL